MFRRILFPALLVCALAASLVGLQYWRAWQRTPGILEQARKRQPMSLSLRDFGAERLAWIVRVQDPAFFDRDPGDMRAAGSGLATITDSMVKSLYFDRYEPGILRWNELRRAIITRAFNNRVTRPEQLKMFINTVYLGYHDGKDILGFEQAARTYYRRPYRDLDDEQFLRLVGMILAPGKYHPLRNPDASNKRLIRIQRLIHDECRPSGVSDVELDGCATGALRL